MRDLCLGDWALHLGLAFVPAGMGWLLLPGKELIYSCSFSSRDAAGLHDVACRVDSPLQRQYSVPVQSFLHLNPEHHILQVG